MLRSILMKDKPPALYDGKAPRLLSGTLANYKQEKKVRLQTYTPNNYLALAKETDGDYYARRGVLRNHTVDHNFVKQIMSAGAIAEMGHMGDELGAVAREHHDAPAHPAPATSDSDSDSDPRYRASAAPPAKKTTVAVKQEGARAMSGGGSSAAAAAPVVKAEVVPEEPKAEAATAAGAAAEAKEAEPDKEPEREPRKAAEASQSVETFKKEYKVSLESLESHSRPKLEEIARAYNDAHGHKQRNGKYINLGADKGKLLRALKAVRAELFPGNYERHATPEKPPSAIRNFLKAGGAADAPMPESPD